MLSDLKETLLDPYLAVSISWVVHVLGVLGVRALLVGVYSRTP